jgi:6-pyruvoyltetrahydropterin/6-carboxytetrahydropterin synthase
MSHTSSKLIELGSTAFRQPRAESHCKYIHGYQLKAELNFACNELDNNNWVFDFGGLKDLKQIFKNQFDHTLVVAGDDPEMELLLQLNEKGVAQLRIMSGGVGIERFAEWCFKTADTFVDEVTNGRVWVESVTVYEHDDNFASYNRSTIKTEEVATTAKEEPVEEPKHEPDPAPQDHNPRAAQVGNVITQGKGNWFKGTSWGD